MKSRPVYPSGSRFTRAVVLAAALAFCGSAHAQNIISNGDFEAPGFTPSPDYYRYLHVVHSTENFLTGWNFAGTVQYQASFLMKAGNGYEPYIGAGTYGVALEEGAIMTTTFLATAGQQYQFSVLARTGDPLPTNAFEVTADGTLATFTPTATFLSYTFNFTAVTTGATTLQLEVDAVGPPSLVAYIDNVSITAIPEPGTYALIGGLLALGVVGVRRRLHAA